MVSLLVEKQFRGPASGEGTGGPPALPCQRTPKTVLDMGCGSGILAILAAKMKAKNVLAIDVDDWAYKNTFENCQRNIARHRLDQLPTHPVPEIQQPLRDGKVVNDNPVPKRLNAETELQRLQAEQKAVQLAD